MPQRKVAARTADRPPRHATMHMVAWAAVIIMLGCRDDRDDFPYDDPATGRAPATDGVSVGVSVSGARFVTTLIGLRNPESVRYDPAQDVYFISNMSGYGSVKDGDGYIVRVNGADPNQASVFIQGGSGGAALDAPKGMAISGDTLWVADIDKLRAFHHVTGTPLTTVDFAPLGATLLNDVAVRPGAELRVTDTGIRMTEKGIWFEGPARVFAVGLGGAVRVVALGPAIGQPNGIAWDSRHDRWVVVSFDRFRWHVLSFADADTTDTLVSRERPGQLDGVEVLPSGAILYSSWGDSSLRVLENGRDAQVIRDVPMPADIGFDPRRQRVAIPLPTMGWVQLWSLGTDLRSR